YQIIVENTGNVALSFNPLSDSGCEAINPSGTITLAVGASATYTCTHVLNAADQKAGYHENCASATATPPAGQGGPITHPSNCVVVKVPTPAQKMVLPFAATTPSLKGPQGCVRNSVAASVKATGVKS